MKTEEHWESKWFARMAVAASLLHDSPHLTKGMRALRDNDSVVQGTIEIINDLLSEADLEEYVVTPYSYWSFAYPSTTV